MRKILSLILVLALALTVVGCADNVSYDSSEDEKSESKNYDEGYDEEYEADDDEDYDEEPSSSPKTIMDAFDGERRLWFRLHEHEVRHDAEVIAVYVIEDKTVKELYYKVKSGIKEPVYGTPFTLAEFDGLSDDEILELVRENYADGGNSYTYDSRTILATTLPYEITYEGALDSSGNALEDETIILSDRSQEDYPWHYFRYLAYDRIITPKVVKNKEYVGFSSGGTWNQLITLNTFSEFDPGFDDIEGAAELY